MFKCVCHAFLLDFVNLNVKSLDHFDHHWAVPTALPPTATYTLSTSISGSYEPLESSRPPSSSSTPNSNPFYSIVVSALDLLLLAGGCLCRFKVLLVISHTRAWTPFTIMHDGFGSSTRSWKAQYNYTSRLHPPAADAGASSSLSHYTDGSEEYSLLFTLGHGTVVTQLSSV